MLQSLPPGRADTLRAVLDTVFAGSHYRWEGRNDPFGVIRRAWLGVQRFLLDLRDRNPDVFRVLLWLLVAVLVVIVAHAAWVAVRTVRDASRHERREGGTGLPASRDAAWYAAEAARLAAEGRYAEAVQADFLRLALELDARRVARFHPSKTPGEYVREAAIPEERRAELRELVRTLYAYAFARVPCDRAAFEAWRARALADRYAPAH